MPGPPRAVPASPAAPAGYKAPLSICNSGDADLKYLLGVELRVASMIGVARVMSDYHLFTVLVGSTVVGSSVGVLVASIHNSPVHVVPVIDHRPEGSAAGIALPGGF